MRILITGSKGQMGNDFQCISKEYPSFDFLFTDLEELDITQPSAIQSFFQAHNPDVIINCAAYTAVDKAETETEKAFLINGEAVGFLAQECTRTGAIMVQVSTDYVFDGKNYKPYTEEDPTNPVSAYARSKWAGELAMHQHAIKGIILRTSWLYSAFGNNFVKTIRRHGAEKEELRVVFDQVGTPTWSRDLCRTILDILPTASGLSGVETIHYSNEGVCSWFDFALMILEYSEIRCRVRPIETWQYPLPAVRPHYSVLNKRKIREKFGVEIPEWRKSLAECIRLM